MINRIAPFHTLHRKLLANRNIAVKTLNCHRNASKKLPPPSTLHPPLKAQSNPTKALSNNQCNEKDLLTVLNNSAAHQQNPGQQDALLPAIK